MRKVLVVALFTVFLILNIDAYGFGYGIRAGLNYSSVSSAREIALPGDKEFLSSISDSYQGFHFGVVGYIPLFNAFIQPEILYTQTGQEFVIRNPDGNENGEHDLFFTNKFSHLSLPVVGGFRFGPLRAGLGPVLSFLLDSSYGNSMLDFDYNDVSVGYQAMLGIKLRSLMIDFKYEGNLNKFGEGIRIGSADLDFDSRPRQFIISVGLLIN